MQNTGGKLLLDALERHWRQYRKRLKACRQSANEDNVHELRVSTRRLLALIELLQTLAPQTTLLRIRKSLKKQLDGFDQLRDTQVMLFESAKSLPILPELEPFLAHMHRCEQRLLLENQSFIASLYQPKLRRKLKKAGKYFKTQTADIDLELAVSSAIDDIYGMVINRYEALDPAIPASIHHLRIAVKKLRYTLFATQSIDSAVTETDLSLLKSQLNRMGDIQNSVVMLQTLELFFQHQIPTAIEQYYRRQQQEMIDSFMTCCSEILTFRHATQNDRNWVFESA
ncbi:CHAD domain-containing protein [Methylomonas sp. MO1]|uniref:CHAD domain-containing protein n=1 Tax=unclassified Methylomonas TaxID=2608980 RepID=UPI00047A6221|nr:MULTISPECIES: CHAD domain-containing protein [unclassified Methylomonas]MDT4288527.1 CHAD domain-containing protein [Methylomonas sp. MO1]